MAVNGKRKENRKIWERMGLAVLCGLLLVVQAVPVQVWAWESEYPVVYGEIPEDECPVMELVEPGGEYTVLPGDCLWNIAAGLWGDGGRYPELIAANEGMLSDPDLIYPGMVLQTVGKGYIVRKDAKYGGIQMGEYSMDMPAGWTVGTLQSGEAWANFFLSGEGMTGIACLIQDRKEETTFSTADWEECVRKIRSYAERSYADSVSDFVFKQYQMPGQEKLYLYSFTYSLDLENYGMDGTLECEICMGMKLTEHIQAEFIGFANDYDILGVVRYVAASFEEHFQDSMEGTFTVNNSNMQLSPETSWEMEGMFNPFPWVEEFFTSFVAEAAGVPQKSADERQELLERISKPLTKQRLH